MVQRCDIGHRVWFDHRDQSPVCQKTNDTIASLNIIHSQIGVLTIQGKQFLKFWNTTAVDLSNEKRMDVLYSLLCVATDRIIMRDDGMIALDVTPQSLEHEQMEKRGVYRKFLA